MPEPEAISKILGTGWRETGERIIADAEAEGRALGIDVERNWWERCGCGDLLIWPKSAEKPPCERCRRLAQERRARNIEAILAAAGVPRRFQRASFDNFRADTEAARRKLQAAREARSRWVFLSGNCGSGKTHLASAILREQALAGREVRFETAAGILVQLRASYRDGSETSEAQLVDRHSRWPVLLVDDLGAEQATEWARATLTHILDKRYGAERQTIITSNLSLDEIAARIDRRLSSRFSEGAVIKMDLPDWRRRR